MIQSVDHDGHSNRSNSVHDLAAALVDLALQLIDDEAGMIAQREEEQAA